MASSEYNQLLACWPADRQHTATTAVSTCVHMLQCMILLTYTAGICCYVITSRCLRHELCAIRWSTWEPRVRSSYQTRCRTVATAKVWQFWPATTTALPHVVCPSVCHTHAAC